MPPKTAGVDHKSYTKYKDELEYRVDRDIADFFQTNEPPVTEENIVAKKQATALQDSESKNSSMTLLTRPNQWKRRGIRFGADIGIPRGAQHPRKSVEEEITGPRDADDSVKIELPGGQLRTRARALKRSAPDDRSGRANEVGTSESKKNARRSEGEILYRNGKFFQKWEKRYMFIEHQREIGKVLNILRLEDGIVSAQRPQRIALRGCNAQPLMSLRGEENEFSLYCSRW